MKLEEIFSEWEADAAIGEKLFDESLRSARLHAKWLRRTIEAALALKQAKLRLKVVRQVRTAWYSGVMTDEGLREHGLKPFRLKLLKNEVAVYVDGDTEVQRAEGVVAVHEAKVDALESIMKTIANRSRDVYNAIEWRKFESGA